jgi:hypothetical protein
MIVPYARPIPGGLLNLGVSLPICLKRRRGAWIGNGLWQDDASETVINGRGIVYPSTNDDLLALPEGERIRKSLTLYWPNRFEMNDRIQHDGEQWRVIFVAPWLHYGYHMAIAQVTQLEN